MAECGLLVAAASLAAEQAPGHLGLSGGGSWALEHRLRGCGTGLVPAWRAGSLWVTACTCSPVLAGGVFTAEPPGKPLIVCVVVVVVF